MNRPLRNPQAPAPQVPSHSRLRVVGSKRPRSRRLLRIALPVVLVLLGGLFAAGLLQGVVMKTQGRVDQLDRQIDEAVSLDRELRLRRAEPLSPVRLAGEARDRLGMVPPVTINYLDPAIPPAP